MSARIEIVIDPKTGEVTYEVSGMPGTGCTDITSALSRGQEVLDEGLTEEYWTPQGEPAYIGQ